MGIKVQVSVCPLAGAHLSALVILVLLDVYRGSLHLEHSCPGPPGDEQDGSTTHYFFSQILPPQSQPEWHQGLLLATALVAPGVGIILCSRREPFCWVAFTGSVHLIRLEPIQVWGGEIAVHDSEGPFVSLLDEVWGSARKHFGSRTFLGLLW